MACTKTTCIMKLEDPNAGKGTYVMRDDDNDTVARRVQLLDDTWDELGRPEVVTVTIEPGDRLNDEPEPHACDPIVASPPWAFS